MRHAFGLGARGLGRTWPNPAVGCVIVKDGRVVGRGWTQPCGRPHAEVRALAQTGEAARGATAYVTLEPCAHHGHTPPCAEALIAAGITRVVTALHDPDPRVAGRGHAMLRAAGIDVAEGVGATAARIAHEGFLRRVTLGLPAVTLKLATTLDGRIATASGESRWITGSEARRQVHALRLCHDAVLVGAGTALADDPDLTVRDMGTSHQPIRVVFDTSLRLPVDSRLGKTAGEVPVWLCHGPDAPATARQAWERAGAKLIECPTRADTLDANAALRKLAEAGLTRVFCEGGGQLAVALLRDDLVTELVAFTAGKVIGAEGRPAIGDMNLTSLAQAKGFSLIDVAPVGGDVISRWRCE
ncbi:MAG: bifunctional diaminohydroxyphosphoribosylaminopyrimidine deaminase/5-amino-6-(5-phosphoribosylamino)uracil reductase RibD [Cereibacter sphaeroides]|uniref:Riboflavin biosynthesis protein RibD n=1 Tax=Cereibacter sphaeroides TaxID=1063 RepID=A0A2W5SMM9_CERSP|nr:MAG: bifunctional diaminohydroxyphosphoribosylaminopyrimidine deaminase/5-amino-6-(5-phosphoribosylamino)uracil reductase RibD [Cereibacter sphaeroides]